MMLRHAIAILAIGVLLATPVWAVDRNHDGLADGDASDTNLSASPGASGASLDEGDIAVVDTGDFSVSIYVDRLTGLGYPVFTIPANSDLEVLLGYSLVILPVSHSDSDNHATFAGLAADYIAYVNSGGGLWVGQPNPYGMPDNEATITWVPYLLRLGNWYDNTDCPPVIVNPDHCITEGLPGVQFSTSGDTVLEMGPEWEILVEGPVTGLPGVLFATSGAGNILVELTHPAPASFCPPDDEALDRYVMCTMGGVVAIESTTWSTVKTLYR
jgi:hypothetical protein